MRVITNFSNSYPVKGQTPARVETEGVIVIDCAPARGVNEDNL